MLFAALILGEIVSSRFFECLSEIYLSDGKRPEKLGTRVIKVGRRPRGDGERDVST